MRAILIAEMFLAAFVSHAAETDGLSVNYDIGRAAGNTIKAADFDYDINPLFPAIRSGHRLLQRPSAQKQIPSSKVSVTVPPASAMVLRLPLGSDK